MELPYDIGVRHIGDGVTLLEEVLDVLAEGLPRLLALVLEVPWVSRAFERALEVRREVLEPCMGRVR